MMNEKTWKSAITRIAPNEVRVRGYRIDEMMGRLDFGQALYLLLKGELPDEKVGRLITAIIVSSIDHGVTPPSVQAARLAASTGASLNASIAGGVLAINRFHGGAVENCARSLGDIVTRARDKSISMKRAAEEVLDELKAGKQRMAGFGHRIHTDDPRTKRLFALTEEAGVSGPHIEAARAVETILEERMGRKLPINVDGAIGAVLCELGFKPEVMNGFFILARVAGMIAHVDEEQSREKPMRRIVADQCQYDGPEPRSL